MSYLSLYRKHRPQTFDQIVGQKHVSETLSNAIVEDRVAHAYLFTGPRGTGKTSTARILAKALNCAQGPTPSPCGVCPSCIAITEGSSLDVIEMDAASHSKVDDTRDILAGVPLATSGGRRKVYVIDEVHMLSTGSFNALLKTLEEPPPHVVFVLATTEAHKVLATILSRTQRFEFRRVPADLLEQHLVHIAEVEGIDIDRGALAAIARHADGGVRDALSALDQLASLPGHIGEQEAEQLLGSRFEDQFEALFDAIAAGDVGALFLTLNTMIGQGADARQLTLGALEHTRSLLLLRTAPDADHLLDVAPEDAAVLAVQAERFSVETLLRIMDLLGKALTDMRTAPSHRLLLEVALVRAAAPETDPSATGLLGRIERLERRLSLPGAAAAPSPAPQGPSSPQTVAPKAAPPKEGQARAGARPAAAAKAPGATRSTAAPASAPPAKQPGPPKPAAEPAAAPAASQAPPPAAAPAEPAPAPVGEVPLSALKDAWPSLIAEVGVRSKMTQGLLNPSRPLSFESGEITVEVQSTFHKDTLGEGRNRTIISDALIAVLGLEARFRFVERGAAGAAAGGGDTPDAAADDDTVDIDATTPADDAEHDPVELIKKGFSAEIVEERTSG